MLTAGIVRVYYRLFYSVVEREREREREVVLVGYVIIM